MVSLRRITLIVVVMLGSASCLVACPTCKEGLAIGENAANLVRGYEWSIVFMMSAPFLILAGISSYFYYEIRRARKEALNLGVES